MTVIFNDPEFNTNATKVIFLNRDGSTLRSYDGPFDGNKVSQVMPAGHVTVAVHMGTTSERLSLVTILDVAPGDVLPIGPPVGPVAGSFPFQLQDPAKSSPPFQAPNITYAYCNPRANVVSGGAPDAVQQAMPSTVCLVDGKLPVLAVAGNGSTPVRFAGGAVEAGSLPTALGPWSSPVGIDVGIADAPASNFYGLGAGLLVSGRLLYVEDDTPTVPSTRILMPDVSQIGFASSYLGRATVNYGPSSSAIFSSQELTSPTIQFDGQGFLPAIHHPHVDNTDPGHPVLAWQADGPLDTADGVLAFLFYDLSSADHTGHVEWYVVGPAGMSLTVPFPSTEYPLLQPGSAATINPDIGLAVVVVGSTSFGSYAGFRNRYNRMPVVFSYSNQGLGPFQFLNPVYPTGPFTMRFTRTGPGGPD